ncbi:hypothetical protein [Celeribacter sp.]|uniref:hypothetical protein n=1 Tax=Celeribacter sp. TaxID=1890673 RepID=UPI003A8FEFEB
MDQRQDFLSRIGRVSQAPQSRLEEMGLDNMGPAQTRTHGRNQRLSEMLERHQAQGVHGRSYAGEPRLKLSQIMSYVLAFAMGGMAAVIARVLRFQISGTEALGSADADLALDVIFAIFVAFILRELVSLSAVKRMGTQFAGILLAIVTMHNVVHEMPDLFSKLFSQQWVQYVTGTTEPGTLYFRGHSYHI